MSENTTVVIQVVPTAIELTKLSLTPGDVLGVKITSDDTKAFSEHSLGHLRDQLEDLFPGTRIMFFCMKSGTNLEFMAIDEAPQSCGPQACADCNCGKKEQLEATNKLAKDT